MADSGAGTTNVLLSFARRLAVSDYTLMLRDESLAKLFSLAAWICKHGHLVSRFKLDGLVCASSAAALLVCQMLSMAWQVAAAGSRPLHLQGFESDITVSAATRCLLNALSDSLAELDIFAQDCLSCREEGWGMVDGVLARLTSLKALTIRSQSRDIFGGAGCEMHPDTLAGLTGLTSLDLAAEVSEVYKRHDVQGKPELSGGPVTPCKANGLMACRFRA